MNHLFSLFFLIQILMVPFLVNGIPVSLYFLGLFYIGQYPSGRDKFFSWIGFQSALFLGPLILLTLFFYQKSGLTGDGFETVFSQAFFEILKMSLFLNGIIFWVSFSGPWNTLWGYRFLSYPLSKVGAPTREGELSLLIARKIFPDLSKELSQLQYLNRLRSPLTGSAGLWGRLREIPPLLIPLLQKVMRLKGEFAQTILERGFHPTKDFNLPSQSISWEWIWKPIILVWGAFFQIGFLGNFWKPIIRVWGAFFQIGFLGNLWP